MSASRRQFNIYSRVEGCSFSSQTCLLFQRKIIFDIIWFPFIVTVYIKPKIWSSSLSSDFRIIYRNDKRGERDCFYVGIRWNSAADSAAKDALDGDISVELIPFSDLKSRTNKYILELWQSEWDEFPENKLYKIFPVLKECIVCPRTNRKEKTVMAQLHIGHSFLTHSFLLKGEEPPVCIGCDNV